MTQDPKTVVGIIGLGSFGKFVAKKLPANVTKLAYENAKNYSTEENSSLQLTSLETLVKESDIIILAIPLASYKDVLPVVRSSIQPNQLLIDICSVKIIPEQIITTEFPNHPNLLISHPLFGARSFDRVGASNRLIVTKSVGNHAERVLEYCSKHLGIEIVRMSADEHDSLMADIHALTFFVAKALENLGVEDHNISTPSYKMITDLVNFSKTHTDSLLQTIENGNPYAKDTRDRLVKAFSDLDRSITESAQDWMG